MKSSKPPFRQSSSFRIRLWTASLLILIMLLALLSRLVDLDVLHYNKFRTLAHNNHVALVPVAPPRGDIVDDHGAILAENRPTFAVEITPDQVQGLQATLDRLQKLIRLDHHDLQRFHDRLAGRPGFDPVILKADLSQSEVAAIAVRSWQLPGVRVVAVLHRYYPYGALFSHVVGYVGPITATDLRDFHARSYLGRNYIGKTGLERFYERQLRGTVGYQIKDINAAGLQVGTLRSQAPLAGDRLVTHLRLRVQKAAAKALQGKGYRGAVVAMNPHTGAVLAMVTSPGFDANWFVDGISTPHWKTLLDDPGRPLMNRADNGLYPPGSCAKPFFSLQALQDNVISPGYHTFCGGNFQLGGHTYWDWNRSGFGNTGLTKALAWSVDVFYYKLAVKMGISLQDKALWRFGFGRRPAIDLPGGAAGLVPTSRWKQSHLHTPWYTGDSVILGIGQGYLLVTPLQLARAVSTLANGGFLVQPRIGKTMVNPLSGEKISLPLSAPVNLHVSAPALHAVHLGMEACVNSGTCRSVSIPGISIAGKTGTAQIPVGHKNGRTIYNNDSLFIGWAPVHHPKIAVAVVVEYGGHNAWQALPVARAVIRAYLQPGRKGKSVQSTEKLAKRGQAPYSSQLPQGRKVLSTLALPKFTKP